jgi:hypothetical protein
MMYLVLPEIEEGDDLHKVVWDYGRLFNSEKEANDFAKNLARAARWDVYKLVQVSTFKGRP